MSDLGWFCFGAGVSFAFWFSLDAILTAVKRRRTAIARLERRLDDRLDAHADRLHGIDLEISDLSATVGAMTQGKRK